MLSSIWIILLLIAENLAYLSEKLDNMQCDSLNQGKLYELTNHLCDIYLNHTKLLGLIKDKSTLTVTRNFETIFFDIIFILKP